MRQIKAPLDLSWVYGELAPYSEIGRPSIDPVLVIRMLIIGYMFAMPMNMLLSAAPYIVVEELESQVLGDREAATQPQRRPRPEQREPGQPSLGRGLAQMQEPGRGRPWGVVTSTEFVSAKLALIPASCAAVAHRGSGKRRNRVPPCGGAPTPDDPVVAHRL